MQLLEPYGTGNSTPLFILKNATVKRISGTKGGEHTRLLVEKNNVCVTGMCFGVSVAELGFECGDSIDLLFNLDINDYKNVKTIQLIVRDFRISADFKKQIIEEKKRYAEIKNGDVFYMSENILPTREDFARVYTVLRREYRNDVSVLDLKGIMKLINSNCDDKINYIKLKYILKVFNELKICDVVELDSDIYRFEVFFNANKTSIEKSNILKKLRTQCVDRL
jgi:single-stranded-DNA-specific exonuclease